MCYDDYFKPFPTLTTPRLTLRMLRMSDAKDLYECCSQPELSLYAEWSPHINISDSSSFISWVISTYRKKQGYVWAIESKLDGKVIGTCSYSFVDKDFKTAEIGYCISKYYWGKGLGPEAAEALLSYGFRIVGFQRIQARVMTENVQSTRVLTKIGMEHEGLLKKAIFCKGKPCDLLIYAITDEMYFIRYNNMDRDEHNAGADNPFFVGKKDRGRSYREKYRF